MKKIGMLILLGTILLSTALAQPFIDTNLTQNITESVRQTSNNALDTEVTLPSWGRGILNVLFRLGDAPLTISKIVLLFLVWVWCVLVIQDILTLTPFFQKGLSWAGAVLIVFLIGVSGAFIQGITLLVALLPSFSFLTKWSAGALFFVLFCIGGLWFLIHKVVAKIKVLKESTDNENNARKIGKDIGMVSLLSRFMR